MARGNKKKFKGRGGGANRGVWATNSSRSFREELPRTNERFEAYYNNNGVLPEEEQAEFWECMRKDLPNSFRFTGSRGHALAVQQKLIDYFIPKISSVTYEGEPVEPPQPVPWYPAHLAWVMNVSKFVIRKFPPLAEFQKFLVSENGIGNISRQELVSMIPPLVMGLKPGMTVLDMCAAPGSKSAQLIELLHEGEEERVRTCSSKSKDNGASDESSVNPEGDWSDDGRATGLLIANDSEQKRAQLLVHQTKRLNSANVIITNHDASNFPSIQIPSKNNRAAYLKFDRILADVPCTGDGTCRKNYAIWKDWTPGNALGLHNLQFRILVRALQMLKVGGRVVYSTCSLNPIENEAVIAAAIEQSGGLENVQIRDCSQELPGLKRTQGLTSWSVMDRRYRHWKTWTDVQKAFKENAWETQLDRDAASRLAESMFPPLAVHEQNRIPLEGCMRVYPHFQNTGGFFITVLEKISEIRPRLSAPETFSKVKPERKEANGSHGSNSNGENSQHAENGTNNEVAATKRPAEDEIDPESKRAKLEIDKPSNILREPDQNRSLTNPGKSRGVQSQEEHFKYLQPDMEVLQDIYKFYSLAPQFPKDRFMVRNATGEPAKGIYYTSELVRDILTMNEGKGIKFVHSGVKMFAKQDAQGQDVCRWRIQTDGLNLLEPWIGAQRIVHLYKRSTLKKMLIELFIKVSGEDWRDLGEVGERVKNMEMGCAVLIVESSGDDPEGFSERMVMPLWRSMHSVNLMLPKDDRKAYLLRIFNDQSPLIDHSTLVFERRKAQSLQDQQPLPIQHTSSESGGEDIEEDDRLIGMDAD